MNSKNNHFLYFSAWLLVGAFIGALVLYFRGDLMIIFDGHEWSAGEPSLMSASAHAPRRGFADAVTIASPSVVSIQSTAIIIDTDQPVSKQEVLQSFLGIDTPHIKKPQTDIISGSGVIFSSDGYILTNYHVISNHGKIEIELYDGRQLPAHLVGSDPETDIAVIKTDASHLPVMEIANINQLKVGDIVLAIGDPFSIGQTVTQGIISATGRTRVSKNTYENFIQTDAAINPGNSGGALINTLGQLVGINSNIYSSTGNYQGISFAIPINLAKQVAESIIKNGYVVRGWLGVEGQEINEDLMKALALNYEHGVLITDVDENGPGDKAGLKRGDIITRINQNRIANTNDVLNMIAAGRPGDKFLIEGFRNRQSFMTTAILGQRPLMSR